MSLRESKEQIEDVIMQKMNLAAIIFAAAVIMFDFGLLWAGLTCGRGGGL